MNIESCTLKEAIEYSLNKLIEQGGACMRHGDFHTTPFCAYSDGQGKHCAIGWLLDHKNYILMEFEGGVRELKNKFGFMLPRIINQEINVFNSFQYIHDIAAIYRRDQAIDIVNLQLDIKTLIDVGVSKELIDSWLLLVAPDLLTKLEVS